MLLQKTTYRHLFIVVCNPLSRKSSTDHSLQAPVSVSIKKENSTRIPLDVQTPDILTLLYQATKAPQPNDREETLLLTHMYIIGQYSSVG